MTIEFADQKLRSVELLLARNQEEVAAALENSKNDPSHVFEWSGRDLAIATTCKRLLNGINRLKEGGSSAESIVASIIREALSGVFYGSLMNSTNMCANAHGVYVHEFWLRVLDAVDVTKHSIEKALLDG